MTIGTNIRKLRLKRNLTLQQLADKVSTSKSYIWEIEKGVSVPSVLLAAKIAKALKTTVDKLLKESI
jgi:transcriptional regulator with XRE-family HTH domain